MNPHPVTHLPSLIFWDAFILSGYVQSLDETRSVFHYFLSLAVTFGGLFITILCKFVFLFSSFSVLAFRHVIALTLFIVLSYCFFDTNYFFFRCCGVLELSNVAFLSLQCLLGLLLCFHRASCYRFWLVLYTTIGGQCYQLSCIFWYLCLVCSLEVGLLSS